MNVVFALILILTMKRLLRLQDLHVALGINLRMSESGKNWLLLPTPVYTTYSRVYNLLRCTKPTPEYSRQPTRAYIYTSVNNRIQCINLLNRIQLLERLTPSSPYNSPAYTMLALHSNKKVSGCYPIIHLYLFPI